MITITQHCLYYVETGDGTHGVYVTTRGGATVAVAATQCDPATPAAGCWSELP